MLLAFASCSHSPAPAAAPVFPKECRENCVTPFGERLGATADGTAAYSNCQPKCVYENPTYVGKDYAGIQWQCVEYARRWLMTHKGLTFESIDVAADLWNKIEHLVHLGSNAPVPLVKHLNGEARPPKPDDLLVWAREYQNTGHVAVVLRVDTKKKLVFVAEENFANAKWPGDYARAIPYVEHGGGTWLLDPYLIGWKSY